MDNSQDVMLKDFRQTEIEINNNKSKFDECIKFYEEINSENNENIDYILQEISLLIDTLKLLDFCISQRKKGISFFNITTFFRYSLALHIRIYKKVKVIINHNNSYKNNKHIKNLQDKINCIIDESKDLRNCLQHDLDPTYKQYFKIRDKISYNKQMQLLHYYLKIVEIIKSTFIAKVEKLDLENYKALSNDKLVGKLSSNDNLDYKNFINLKQMSYKAMLMDKSQLLIFDITQKYIELVNLSKYVVNLNNTNSKIQINVDTYNYFSNIAFIICYQILDKTGILINDKLNLNIKDAYFSSVIDIIDNLTLNKPFEELLKFSKTEEYNYLKKIRNFNEHKIGKINIKDHEKINTLIVNLKTYFDTIIYNLYLSNF